MMGMKPSVPQNINLQTKKVGAVQNTHTHTPTHTNKSQVTNTAEKAYSDVSNSVELKATNHPLNHQLKSTLSRQFL